MPDHPSIDALNDLFTLLCRSLVMYVADACPRTHRGDERATMVVQDVVADQKEMAARVAELIVERGGRPDAGSFPMTYTDLNLLSLDYLLRELAIEQRRAVAAFQSCAAELGGDSEARELAEEALGQARAHLDALESLSSQAVAS